VKRIWHCIPIMIPDGTPVDLTDAVVEISDAKHGVISVGFIKDPYPVETEEEVWTGLRHSVEPGTHPSKASLPDSAHESEELCGGLHRHYHAPKKCWDGCACTTKCFK